MLSFSSADMQKLRFFFLSLVVSSALISTLKMTAQDMLAFSEEGHWIINYNEAVQVWDPEWNTYIWVGQDSYMYYQTEGDTLINEVSYKKLIACGAYLNDDGSFDIPIEFSSFHVLAYRNDLQRRSYKIMAGETEEILWHDFSYYVEDIVDPENLPEGFGANYDLLLTYVDSVLWCGQNYERQHFGGEIGEEYNLNRTQRVGNFNQFIEPIESGFVYDHMLFFCEGEVNLEDISQNDPFTSVDESKKDNSFTVFPNPCTDYISVSSHYSTSESTLSIYSLLGEQVVQTRSANKKVYVGDLPNGTYILRLQSSQGIGYSRFVKQP